MSKLYAHLCQQLQPYHQRRLVLALSGGVDSRVLLALLARYRDDFAASVRAVHVHHGLSQNADSWASQCQKWCDDHSIELSIEYVRLDTSRGESIEKLAREARYQALKKHVAPGDVLLVAQHADDQIETFLLALKRGSGPKGLSSMAKSSAFGLGSLLRPFLTVKRSEIESCANALELEWVTDESNSDTRYERNYIRHKITPALTTRWPSLHESVQRTVELCAEQELLLEELLHSALQQAMAEDGSLIIKELIKHSEAVRRQLIRQWFRRCHLPMPSRKHTEMIWNEVALAKHDANPILKLSDYEVRRYCGHLYCVAEYQDVSDWKSAVNPNQPLLLPDNLGTVELVTSCHGSLSLPDNHDDLWISFNPEGLSACPVGRVGSRKLKKLFQEYAVPSWLRRRIPILMYQNQVVAVGNLFVDRDFSGQDYELVWDKS